MDSASLKDLYRGSPIAKALFQWAASMDAADDKETTLDKIAEVSPALRGDAVIFARKISDLNFGTFIVGRRKSPSRIRWTLGLKRTAEIARSNDSILNDLGLNAYRPDSISAPKEAVAETLLTISEAKRRLGLTFGVAPDAIEIIIRG